MKKGNRLALVVFLLGSFTLVSQAIQSEHLEDWLILMLFVIVCGIGQIIRQQRDLDLSSAVAITAVGFGSLWVFAKFMRWIWETKILR